MNLPNGWLNKQQTFLTQLYRHFCDQFKTEFGTVLAKEANPFNEDQIRVISLTDRMALLFEKFILKWMWPYVAPYFDRNQFGGMARHSISHYLIELYNAILYNLDLDEPHATVLLMVDFSKGFNRVEHNNIVTILSDMNVPGWLLKIIISYLSNRELRVRYKGFVSETEPLPGGGQDKGQVTDLGSG